MMSSRSQNRPPRSPISVKKKNGLGEVSQDKRRKTASGRALGSGRGRPPLSAVTNRKDGVEAADPGSTEGSDYGAVDFTKDEIEALFEKPKTKQFDHKGNQKRMDEYIRKVQLCIRWFQERDERHHLEQEKFQSSIESAERKLSDTELEMKKNEAELSAVVQELRTENASLEERYSKELSDKLDAIECSRKEKEARIAAERLQVSLSEEVAKAEQDKKIAKDNIESLHDMHKRAKEYNVRLQDYNIELQKKLTESEESLKRVEEVKAAIVEDRAKLKSHQASLQDQLIASRRSQDDAAKQKEALLLELNCLRGELRQVREDRDRQLQQLQVLTVEFTKYKESAGKSYMELDHLTIKTTALEETCSSQREQIKFLQHQLAAASEKLKMADQTASETRTGYEEQKRLVCELQGRLAETEIKIAEGEKMRKKLHNTILELKGNIRVFCRVRPILPEDCDETEVVAYPTSTEALGRGIDLIQNEQRYPFTFDKVFSPESSQQDVFIEISQLVQSALDGYKVCIFAYGQTGSGKTYTMMGRPEAEEQKGLIPRSLEQIFQASQSLSSQGWKFKMQASMLEIYNETIRDLLSLSRSSSSDFTRLENGVPGKQYTITHDASGNTHVSDLTIVDVCNMNEISSLLQQAAQSRSVGKTQMNEQSSRSHFVFTLRISGSNEGTEQQVQGVLNLIDLAGSERLSRSGATGDRLKETQAINKSLSYLSDVIFALAKKDKHVPFRNSTLTYLLQPCLGGDSKTLMFVNISPEHSSVGESLCSLRFAARVNSCEIGIPRRQTSMKIADSRLSYG